MASPTEAEIKAMTSAAFDLLDESRKFAGVSSPNFLGLEDTLIQSLETDFADDITAAAASMRSSLNGLFGNGSTLLTGCFRTYGKFIQAPETDVASILIRLYDYYVANTLAVTSRQFSFGAVAAGGGNVGTGTVNRLNVDRNNFPIESQFADIKTLTCIRDEFSGAQKHSEVFEIHGSAPSRDGLLLAGSGDKAEITAATVNDSSRFMLNPSFDVITGTPSVLTGITNWTVGSSIANFQGDAVNYYRAAPGVTTPLSIRFNANDSLTQAFTVANADFDPEIPYYAQIAYNDQIGAAAAGTLTLTVGDQTESVALTGAGGWKILRIAIGQKNWYDTFKATTPIFKIEVAGLGGGTSVRVDDFVIAPYTQFDNSWYCVVGGQTAFQRNDVFTFTDTEVGAVIQYWLFRLFGAYLPATTGGGVTWVDP